MKFYRIEHPSDGFGIFISKSIDKVPEKRTVYCLGLDDLIERHSSGDFPSPYGDEFINFDSSFKCGFISLSHLEKWVTNLEMNVLLNNGYEVFEINNPSAQCSQYQVIYKEEEITAKNNITIRFK
ncbi:MAG: hypothetical protein JKX82_04930 [Oleispira sp.]|nr:hypothetical protein [Oleispira sp.]